MGSEDKTSPKEGEERWLVLEYENLHRELNSRIIFLYKTIVVAIVLWALFLVVFVGLVVARADKKLIITYLLFVPVIIDLVAFVYQTNQNSLESIPRYFHLKIKPKLDKKYGVDMLSWEKFFAREKWSFRIESITKVLPFVLPSAIPIYLLLDKYPLENYQVVIAWIDIMLLVIMLENFRYKLRRVK